MSNFLWRNKRRQNLLRKRNKEKWKRIKSVKRIRINKNKKKSLQTNGIKLLHRF